MIEQIMLQSLLGFSYSSLLTAVRTYGYLALFVLMALESASLPVPSEVLVPLAGYLSAIGALNPALAFLALTLGGMLGMLVDYYIGYFIGKDIVYKHLSAFRISRERLDAFDRWFERNGTFAVFVMRFIPEVRGLISFPAGFARMPLKKFLSASLFGSFIWDLVLMSFGYYVLSVGSAVTVLAAIGIFCIALYVIYRYAGKRTGSGKGARA